MWYAVIYGFACAVCAAQPGYSGPREIIGYIGPMPTEMQCFILTPEWPHNKDGKTIPGGFSHCEQLSHEPPEHRMLMEKPHD